MARGDFNPKPASRRAMKKAREAFENLHLDWMDIDNFMATVAAQTHAAICDAVGKFESALKEASEP